MTPEFILLGLVVLIALAFDFTNGFHDTANAMAASIATGALRPKMAVTLAAVLNLVGAFLSVEVALTVTNSVIRIQNPDGSPRTDLLDQHGHLLLMILLAGMTGAIGWNLLTWLLGLPSSSSHALFGGLVGATLAALGPDAVVWIGEGSKLNGVVGKVILPALFAPVIAGIVAGTSTWLLLRLTRRFSQTFAHRGFRIGQIGTASLLSLSHGTNDAQKTMGVITLALIAAGLWTDTEGIPWEVKVACAVAIAAGTYLGGWRIIRTLGRGLVDIQPPQGLAADAASATTILASSQLGFALSTTHVATGSIMGTGLGSGQKVRWAMAGRMLVAWLTTLPAAGLAAALMYWLGMALGPQFGPIAIVAILVALALWMFFHSRRDSIHPGNVNDDWETPSAATQEVERP